MPICRLLHASVRSVRAQCCQRRLRRFWLVLQRTRKAKEAPMPEPDRIIRLRTVLARTGLSRSTIYRKIAEGTFPAQVRISINGAGWRESDVNRWVADPPGWRGAGRGDN